MAVRLFLLCVLAALPAAADRPLVDDAPLRDVLLGAADDADYAGASASAVAHLDGLIAHADITRDTEQIVDAVVAVKLLELFGSPASAHIEPGLLSVLIEHPMLARELALLVVKGVDSPAGALTTLSEIVEAAGRHSPDLNRDASLIAALCVVHDVPRVLERNENSVVPAPAADLYRYFSSRRSRLHLDHRDLPPELLAHVVDAGSPIEELEWALGSYRGTRSIGNLYFDIEYDDDAFGQTERRLTSAGFNLPNIRRYGGVCVDQAHFAGEVGKALGVPTAYVTGRSVIGHAWVGFMQTSRTDASWNFDSGRYAAYRSMVGRVEEPRSGREVEESRVVLLEGLARVSRQTRHEARALAYVSDRMRQLRRQGGYPEHVQDRESARELSVNSELAMLRRALERCPTIPELWDPIAGYASRGELSDASLREWGEAILRMAGERHPGFAARYLIPIAESMENARDRDRVLDHLIEVAGPARDVEAQVRLHQARRTLADGDQELAYEMFSYIARGFINDAPHAMSALREAESMLVEAGREDFAPRLYEEVWREAERPDRFASISAWNRVGERLAYHLERTGQSSRARAVRMQLAVH